MADLALADIGHKLFALALSVKLAPIREFVFVHINIELRNSSLKALLHVGDRLVVDNGTQLLQKEGQEPAGGNVSNLLFHAFQEVPFYGSDCLQVRFFREFNCHWQEFLSEWSLIVCVEALVN
jgi:hypothetical protein